MGNEVAGLRAEYGYTAMAERLVAEDEGVKI